MAFTGIPTAAFDFYDDLEIDNSKVFWEAHKEQYLTAVRQPMTELVAALEDEFGAAKLFRPYRDVRFSHDKTAYKTHQGAFVEAAPATGYYLQVGAPGLRVGAGFYHADPDALAAYREAVDGPDGAELERLVRRLEKAGFERGGDVLKSSPRGYPADHPRIDLLRHRSLTFGFDHGFDPVIQTPELVDRVRADWRRCRPLVEWIAAHLRRR